MMPGSANMGPMPPGPIGGMYPPSINPQTNGMMPPPAPLMGGKSSEMNPIANGPNGMPHSIQPAVSQMSAYPGGGVQSPHMQPQGQGINTQTNGHGGMPHMGGKPPGMGPMANGQAGMMPPSIQQPHGPSGMQPAVSQISGYPGGGMTHPGIQQQANQMQSPAIPQSGMKQPGMQLSGPPGMQQPPRASGMQQSPSRQQAPVYPGMQQPPGMYQPTGPQGMQQPPAPPGMQQSSGPQSMQQAPSPSCMQQTAGPSGMQPSRPPGMPPGPPGMQPQGRQLPGMHPPGMQQQGMQPLGQQQQQGMQPHGMRPPGMQPPGMQPPGMQRPGMQSPGMQPPGMQPPGMQPPGMQPPGMQPPGMQPPGMQPPGMQPPGMQPPGMQPPGMHQQGLGPRGMMPPGQQPGMGGYPGGGGQPPGMGHQPQRPKLDPNLMPSAIQVMEDDKNSRSGVFQSGFPNAEVPPLVTTDFYTQDQGNSNPRFMRSTLYCAPASADLLKSSAVPFAVNVCPFSRQNENEYPPPLVNYGNMGPPRCHRCKAYICPFMEFQDGGRRFRCPFCKSCTDVATEYFAHLDHTGRRTDIAERPELFLGSYEFVATQEYCKNGIAPKAPAFVFMLDVSYNAVRNGIVNLFCRNIKQLLADLPKDSNAEKSEIHVAFATYDQTVHFYNLKNALDQPQMLIVGDIADMFVPMVEGFMVKLDEAEAVIDSLLEEIPKMFQDTRITEVMLGPVVQAGLDALRAADRSGKLFIFHSSLPILEAPGKLKNREDRKLLGTEKEKTILVPSGDYYAKLAVECVTAGCCVDMFVFPNSYIDVATIGNLCGGTGGQLFKYQYFSPEVDGVRFLEDLRDDISKPIAFDSIMRVRTSTGIRPTDFYGSMYMQNTTDVELAAVDCNKSITIEIKHDDKLDEQSAFIQAAVLFTSCSGQRRLRIHNLCLKVEDNHTGIYRVADLDTIVNFIAKQAGRMVLQKTPKEVREHLLSRCAQILATYREKCSENAPAGQLILPECMKLLPLYTNCIMRHDAFSGGSELTTDDRSWLLQQVPSLRVSDSVCFFYPRLVKVSDIPGPDVKDELIPVRCSVENLVSSSAYVLENGINLFLWIGLGTAQNWVQDVFGCNAVTQIDAEKNILPEKDNESSRYLRSTIERLHYDRPRRMKLMIIRQQDKLEPWFKKFLVEDRAADNSPSYVDFLCHVHREIRGILS